MEFDVLRLLQKSPTSQDSTQLDGQLLSHLVGEVLKVGLDEAGLSSMFNLKFSAKNLKLPPKKIIASHVKR
jgi:hypothetical protein